MDYTVQQMDYISDGKITLDTILMDLSEVSCKSTSATRNFR